MSTKFPKDLLTQAQNVLGGWNQLTPVPPLGALTTATFTNDLSALTTLDLQIAGLEAQLADKRNQRETMAIRLWDRVKRIRNGIKSLFGDDSSEYEMVGGIRMSERKFRTRKRLVTE